MESETISPMLVSGIIADSGLLVVVVASSSKNPAKSSSPNAASVPCF